MSTILNVTTNVQPIADGLRNKKSEETKDTKGFGERVNEFINDVNDLQLEAGEMAEKFAKGEVQDVHDVMIAAEKASVGLEMVLEIRNRLVEAYREIMRTQM